MSGAIIVLEGHDGAGKTTLAKAIASACQGQSHYAHCVYRFKGCMFAYHAAVVADAVERAARGQVVVIDRLWMSEAIYAGVHRGGSSVPHSGRLLDRLLLRHGAITAVCVTSADHARSVVADNPGRDLYSDSEKAGLVAAHYASVLSGCGGAPDYAGSVSRQRRSDIVGYNFKTDGSDTDGFAKGLVEVAKIRRKRAMVVPLEVSGQNLLGFAQACSVLFVGDKHNSNNPRVTWPFFKYDGSSLWLAEACRLARIDEATACYVNANGFNALDTILGVRHESAYRPVRVVALGRLAHDWLERWEIEHAEVPHPQYARRFESLRMDTYSQSIAEAAGSAALLSPCSSAPRSAPRTASPQAR